MDKYIITMGTGAGDTEIESDDLDDVKAFADEEITYTQTDLSILDEDGNLITKRTWVGCESELEDQDDPISYGSFGYYTDWSD